MTELRPLVRYKKRPGEKLPKNNKAEYLKRYNETKNRASPHVSPSSSDDEFFGEDPEDEEHVSIVEEGLKLPVDFKSDGESIASEDSLGSDSSEEEISLGNDRDDDISLSEGSDGESLGDDSDKEESSENEDEEYEDEE